MIRPTRFGMILEIDVSYPFANNITFVPLLDADAEKVFPLLEYQLTLKRLCSSNEKLNARQTPTFLEQRFESMYSIQAKFARKLVEQIQTGLRILQISPIVDQIDGIYSNRLVATVKQFQIVSNQRLVKVFTTGI